jgi:hypothetical protein
MILSVLDSVVALPSGPLLYISPLGGLTGNNLNGNSCLTAVHCVNCRIVVCLLGARPMAPLHLGNSDERTGV